MIFKKTTELADKFCDVALSFVGYRARESRDNMFGERRRINGQPWDGIFIDVVAEESGMPLGPDGALPYLTYPPVAMSQFVRTDRFFKRPAKGDIVFFETSTVSDFGMPHVGIVTDAKRHAIDGTFECVEGMTSSGSAKRLDGNDGVHLRKRHASEVIGFGRPNFEKRHAIESAKVQRLPSVTLEHLRNGARPNKSVELVQVALHEVTGISGYLRGKFDTLTRLAYAKYQRSLGYTTSKATGDVDISSLRELGRSTRVFSVK